MCEIKSKHVYNDFSKNNEMFRFSNHSAMSKYYNDSNPLVVVKMKDKMDGVAIVGQF